MVIAWFSVFVIVYRALALMPLSELQHAVEKNLRYGKPPYGWRQRALASGGMAFFCLLLLLFFGGMWGDISLFGLLFNGPFDSNLVTGWRKYIVVAVISSAVLWLLVIFHGARYFLGVLRKDGFLDQSN